MTPYQKACALQELHALTAKMRELQREYFRTRDRETLRAAKEAEREVDAMLKRLDGRQSWPASSLWS